MMRGLLYIILLHSVNFINFLKDYSQTFANWLKNFDNNQETIKDLNDRMDYADFRWLWRFYLLWFICNFASCDGEYNGNGQYLMVHV